MIKIKKQLFLLASLIIVLISLPFFNIFLENKNITNNYSLHASSSTIPVFNITKIQRNQNDNVRFTIKEINPDVVIDNSVDITVQQYGSTVDFLSGINLSSGQYKTPWYSGFNFGDEITFLFDGTVGGVPFHEIAVISPEELQVVKIDPEINITSFEINHETFQNYDDASIAFEGDISDVDNVIDPTTTPYVELMKYNTTTLSYELVSTINSSSLSFPNGTVFSNLEDGIYSLDFYAEYLDGGILDNFDSISGIVIEEGEIPVIPPTPNPIFNLNKFQAMHDYSTDEIVLMLQIYAIDIEEANSVLEYKLLKDNVTEIDWTTWIGTENGTNVEEFRGATLLPGSDYEIIVRFENDVSSEQSLIVTTEEIKDPFISSSTPINPTTTSVSFQLGVDDYTCFDSGTTFEYIFYEYSNPSTVIDQAFFTFTSNIHILTFNGLNPGTPYMVDIIVRDQLGDIFQTFSLLDITLYTSYVSPEIDLYLEEDIISQNTVNWEVVNYDLSEVVTSINLLFINLNTKGIEANISIDTTLYSSTGSFVAQAPWDDYAVIIDVMYEEENDNRDILMQTSQMNITSDIASTIYNTSEYESESKVNYITIGTVTSTSVTLNYDFWLGSGNGQIKWSLDGGVNWTNETTLATNGSNTLQINNLDVNTQYTIIIAPDQFEHHAASIIVNTLVSASHITDLVATNVTETTVDLEFNFFLGDGDGQVEYSLDNENNWTTFSQTAINGQNTFTIDSLNPGENYNVIVRPTIYNANSDTTNFVTITSSTPDGETTDDSDNTWIWIIVTSLLGATILGFSIFKFVKWVSKRNSNNL